MDALIDRLFGHSGGPYRALLRTGYHTNYFIVVMGALMDPIYEASFGARLVGRLAALYVSFNLLLYGGIYTVNAIVDVEEDLQQQPADPVQAKIFMFLPLFFTFLLARFPAGLVIYWAWNNLLSIIQQKIIMIKMGVK